MLFSEVKRILIQHKEELIKRGARTLSLFGSVARDEATEESDVDVLIDADSNVGTLRLARLKLYLESLLGCKVDIASYGMLRPSMKDEILHEAKRVF
jgi:predicted nucleotidyltransferase